MRIDRRSRGRVARSRGAGSGPVACFRIDAAACPAVPFLPPGSSLRCLRPGDPGPPLGFVDAAPEGVWLPIAEVGRGWLARCSRVTCVGCPVARVAPPAIVLDACVRADGVRVRVAAPTGRDHAAARLALASSGAAVSVESIAGAAASEADRRVVDLSRLTPRQAEVLRTAHAAGLFELRSGVTLADVGRLVGASPSTTHEHLHRALQTLLDACFRS